MLGVFSNMFQASIQVFAHASEGPLHHVHHTAFTIAPCDFVTMTVTEWRPTCGGGQDLTVLNSLITKRYQTLLWYLKDPTISSCYISITFLIFKYHFPI